MESSVTHDLLYQSYGFCGVGFIKEDDGIQISGTVLLSFVFCLFYELLNVFLRYATVYLNKSTCKYTPYTLESTYLQYEHVSLATTLSCEVTHKPNESCLATASLPHDHHWNSTPAT